MYSRISNVASESLWSLAGYISEDERSSTGAALIEAQLMVRRNYLECQNVKKALGIEETKVATQGGLTFHKPFLFLH